MTGNHRCVVWINGVTTVVLLLLGPDLATRYGATGMAIASATANRGAKRARVAMCLGHAGNLDARGCLARALEVAFHGERQRGTCPARES